MGTGIRPLEVIPAIEILYIQFRSLTDRMAHSNVIVILMLLSKIPSNTPPPPGGGFGYLPQGISLAQAHYKFNSDETNDALHTTFPEMIAYLKENLLL
ncbi:hypothetical protein PRIPAC_72467 [Pristionchus pacificus]|uniref:Uncharacterized protein n=1 Tax=Pristionchus pacificus TaxID=54126 RepID=A0A454XV08_PRIPA|nr:hypothetical protein PRIPAC_72467 [Pristionchus pacificus]|eukprot:PDM71501.1 hypothetical protein PRIPAC_37908 [Pristionchus pacificus]